MRLLAFLALLTLAVPALSPARAQSRSGVVVRYEYARLAIWNADATRSVSWRHGNENDEASTLYDLFRILGGESDRGDFMILKFYNLVGNDGWLLVDVEKSDVFDTHTFVRPKR